MLLKALGKLMVCAAVLISANADAQTNLKENIPVDSKVKIGKLENGLPVCFRGTQRPES